MTINRLRTTVVRYILNYINEALNSKDRPRVTIDIGQVESGEWTIIEVGDGQFAGHSQIPLLELWNKLREAMAE